MGVAYLDLVYRLEEQCLVRSGLVKLLNQLCSLVDEHKPMDVGGEEEESLHRVTALAWAAFQVLADHCVSWETQDSAVLSSGLAQQVRGRGGDSPHMIHVVTLSPRFRHY